MAPLHGAVGSPLGTCSLHTKYTVFMLSQCVLIEWISRNKFNRWFGLTQF